MWIRSLHLLSVSVIVRFTPSSMLLHLAVNGDVKQDGNTRDMIWSVAEEISEVSKHRHSSRVILF